MVRSASLTLFMAASVLGLTACDRQAEQAATTDAAPAAAPAPPTTLPVSLNEMMVAMVSEASDPIWLDAYDPPKNPTEWKQLEYHGYQMAVNGKVIQLPGTGPNDAAWVRDPKWISFANEMSAAGMDAIVAARAKNVDAVNKAGDRLVEACEGCHKVFKPSLTSMGVYKLPGFPPGYEPK